MGHSLKTTAVVPPSAGRTARGRSFSFGVQRRPDCRPGDAAGSEDHGEIRSRKHATFIMRRAAYSIGQSQWTRCGRRTLTQPQRASMACSTPRRLTADRRRSELANRMARARTTEPRHGRPWVVSAMSYVGYYPSNCIRALGGGVGTPARSGLRHRNPETRRRMGRKRARKRTLQSRA